MNIQLLKKLPIGTRYKIIHAPKSSHDARLDDDRIVWVKTGKTVSKCNPSQRIGTRHDLRLRVEVVE